MRHSDEVLFVLRVRHLAPSVRCREIRTELKKLLLVLLLPLVGQRLPRVLFLLVLLLVPGYRGGEVFLVPRVRLLALFLAPGVCRDRRSNLV